MSIQVGILGATGYTGLELIRILVRHPQAAVAFCSSRSHAGKHLSDVFPELHTIFDPVLLSLESTHDQTIDCLFSCLPHGASARECLPWIEKGIRVIDLSADFRIHDPAVYETWYGGAHPCPELLDSAVFGLPERYRESIRQAPLVANPGCYATSVLVPALPLFSQGIHAVSHIIADAKSGVSGAGRSLKQASLFCEAHENLTPYAIGRSHRHIGEIDQELSLAAGKGVRSVFSPHLVPLNRGIVSTIYVTTTLSPAQCRDILFDTYRDEPFVRLRKPDDLPCAGGVRHTNFCDCAVVETNHGVNDPVICVAAIDNLVKGASGQAVQNMNVMFGFPETAGLA